MRDRESMSADENPGDDTAVDGESSGELESSPGPNMHKDVDVQHVWSCWHDDCVACDRPSDGLLYLFIETLYRPVFRTA